MLTLDEVFAKYPGTDKVHTLHSYGEFYERLFEPRRATVQTVLEVGVRDGSSLKAWKEYFFNATHVIGLDNGEECGLWVPDVASIEVLAADVLKPETVTGAMRRFGFEFFDIIIDDGCHKSHAQAATYGQLRPFLAPGGIYVIEDIESIEEAHKMQELFGGTVEDRKLVKGRHDDILLYFNK